MESRQRRSGAPLQEDRFRHFVSQTRLTSGTLHKRAAGERRECDVSTPETNLTAFIYLSERLLLNQAVAGATLQWQAVSLTVDKQVRLEWANSRKKPGASEGSCFPVNTGGGISSDWLKPGKRGSRLLAGVG